MCLPPKNPKLKWPPGCLTSPSSLWEQAGDRPYAGDGERKNRMAGGGDVRRGEETGERVEGDGGDSGVGWKR